MNTVELFCGRANVSKELQQRGHNTFTVDLRKRKGTCEPDLRADVLKLSPQDFPYAPEFSISYVPCTAFSHAAGDKYFKAGCFRAAALPFLRLTNHTLQLIESWIKMYPDHKYIIENPRGHLRHFRPMREFLARTNGTIKTITLSSYGFPTTKPTDLFTNCLDLYTKATRPFGRGAKCAAHFNNLTTAQRQTTPELLASSIADYLDNVPSSLTPYQGSIFSAYCNGLAQSENSAEVGGHFGRPHPTQHNPSSPLNPL